MPTLISDTAATKRTGLKSELIARAHKLGFYILRVTTPEAAPEAGARLMAFLAQGRHGDMQWMQTTAARRRHPVALWPQAHSVIIVGQSYAPAHDPLAVLEQPQRGAISVYAQGRDYHDVVKGKLKQLGSWLVARAGGDIKVFVDTAPVMEKPLAAAAGVGWQGKHTNLVSREHGSWLFLGSIFTTAVIAPDSAEPDRCGNCRRCLDVCPTNAFPAPYELDARRCISYLTIEHKGHIARDLRAAIGNRIFGCDDCLAVCPWNKFAQASRETRYAVGEATDAPALAELLELDDAGFRARFAGTPVRRAGRDRFIRNVLISAGNANEPNLLPKVEALLADPSPLVRAMAVWACGRLADGPHFAHLCARYGATEPDPDVRTEWQQGTALHQGPLPP